MCLGIAVVGAVVAGCHAKEPESPSVGLTSAVNPPRAPDLGRGEPRTGNEVLYRIYLGETIPAVCAGPVPYFEFDDQKTRSNDQPTLQTLVDCMRTGPLTGKSIVLVGRTDPKGRSDYNERLGLERAQSVKRYLITNGVAEARIKTVTGGEEDASKDPDHWPLDRRVDVRLDE